MLTGIYRVIISYFYYEKIIFIWIDYFLSTLEPVK